MASKFKKVQLTGRRKVVALEKHIKQLADAKRARRAKAKRAEPSLKLIDALTR